jgi:hypothetical protein
MFVITHLLQKKMWCNNGKGLWPSKWKSWVQVHLPALSYVPPRFEKNISGVAFLGGEG